MAKRTSNDGADLENLIAILYQALKDVPNTTIVSNAKVPSKLGKGKGQIDVLIETRANGIILKTAIECKDYNKPVSVEKIDAFKAKCDRLIGIDKCIIVSSSGFQAQAYEAAHHHGVHLYTLKNITSEDVIGWIDAHAVKSIQLDSIRIMQIEILVDQNQSIIIKDPKENILLHLNDNAKFHIDKYVFNIEVPLIEDMTLKLFGNGQSLEGIGKVVAKAKRTSTPTSLNKLFIEKGTDMLFVKQISYEVSYEYTIGIFSEIKARSYQDMQKENNEVQIVTLAKDGNKINFIKTQDFDYKVYLISNDGISEELTLKN